MASAVDTVSPPVWNAERSMARRCKRWSVYPPGVLDLGVAEMDVSACPPVLDAVRDAVSAEAFGYPVPDRRSDVPRAAVRWLSGLGLTVGPDEVRIVPDVMRGIAVAIRRLTRPRSAVLLPTPAYARFFEVVELAGRQYVEVPLLATAGGYRLDLDAIERGLAAGAGSVLLCNPINPVGAVLGRDDLAALAALADRWGARVIADEVHAPIRYGAEFTPYAAVSEVSRAHAVTVTGATKAWNFPGLRTAVVALTGPGDARVWDGLRHVETTGASPLGMVATVAALNRGRPWLDAVLRDLDHARGVVVGHFAGAGLAEVVRPPQATYFAWLDLRAWKLPAPGAFLLERAGVAVGEGAHYGSAGTGFVRLNFATPIGVLTAALDRITTALASEGDIGRNAS